MEEIESSINRYLTALDTADRQEPAVAQVKAERLHQRLRAQDADLGSDSGQPLRQR
ncbi:hypothetical protein PSEUDO9AG_40616 [Pseudomonas sp. 9Ag]|nr:hypothetical protein PSEUDO9AG_40616 [Pseudomonas sp. 9Ag]